MRAKGSMELMLLNAKLRNAKLRYCPNTGDISLIIVFLLFKSNSHL